MAEKLRIALVRGDSLKEQETKIWEGMDDKFETVAFCGKKNVFPLSDIKLNYRRLANTADNFISKNFFKYVCGQYQRMFGLEKELFSFDIAHGVETYNYYTLQCVRAKKMNPKLKVVSNFSDNTFGRFEYNYWPGFSVAPKYWRNKVNAVIKECVEGVDKFLVFSHYAADLLFELGATSKQVVVEYPGILIENKGDELYKKLKLENVEFYLVVCRMIWEKGIYDILYGWKMYIKNITDNKKLIVIGNGSETKNFQRMVDDFGLSDSVVVLGQVPNSQVKELYSYAKAFFLGSIPTRTWQDQTPYVLMEAITQDCPIIATNSGGNPEIVGSAGVLIPAANPVEVKKALIKLDDKIYYQTLKENALQEKIRFDMQRYRNRLADIYYSLF